MNLKISSKSYYELLLVLSFSFLLLSKSLAGSILSTLFSVGLIILLLFNLLGTGTITFRRELAFNIFWVYLALFLFSIIRQYFNTDLSLTGTVNVLLFFFTIVLIQLVAVQRIKPNLQNVLRSLYFIINTYIYLNVILYLLGFVHERYPGVNEMLGLFGIYIDRVFFIFAPSMAYFAMISGIGALISLFLYRKHRSIHFLVSTVVCFAALILTDSRGPIFTLVVILVFLFLARRFWLKNQLLLILFYLLSVTLFISAMALIDAYIFDIDQLSRENSTLLSWREVIWELFFEHYEPSLMEFLFGYGNVGQKISGLSSEYEFLFANWPNPEEISLHNNTLQMLVDIGLVGIISFYSVIYYVIYKAIKIYRHTKDDVILLIPAVLNYILIMGFSDIVVNISNVGIYFVLLFLIIAVLYYQHDHIKEQAET